MRRPAEIHLPQGQDGHPPTPRLSRSPLHRDSRSGSASPRDASTASRGRRHATRHGYHRAGSQVPGQRAGRVPWVLRAPSPETPGAAGGAPGRGPGTSPHPHPAAGRVCGSRLPFFASQRLGRDPRGGSHSPYYRWRRCFGQSLV